MHQKWSYGRDFQLKCIWTASYVMDQISMQVYESRTWLVPEGSFASSTITCFYHLMCIYCTSITEKSFAKHRLFIRNDNFDLVSDTDLTNETQRLKIIGCIWAGAKLEVLSASHRRGKYIRLRRSHDTSFNPQRSKKLSSVCTRLVSTPMRAPWF